MRAGYFSTLHIDNDLFSPVRDLLIQCTIPSAVQCRLDGRAVDCIRRNSGPETLSNAPPSFLQGSNQGPDLNGSTCIKGLY